MKKLLIIIFVISIMFSGCADKTQYVASVGGEKISVSELEFYLESVKSQMAGTELSSDEDWETKEIEGRKAIDLAKEKALETAIDNLAYIEVGKALGVELVSEDKKAIDTVKKQYVEQIGGEKEYKEFLKTNNLKNSFIDMLCESMMYNVKLEENITKDKPVTDEEISAYFNENKEDLSSSYRHAKHILILTKNMDTMQALSQEEQEHAKTLAEDLLNRAKSGEDFDTLAKEYSQDPGLAMQPDGYVFGDGEMVPQFQDGTDSLQTGEIGMAESDIGYHIILRLPLDLEDVADRLKAELTAKRLDEYMDNWISENGISVEKYEEVIANI